MMEILKIASEHGILAVVIALLGWLVITIYSRRLQKKSSVESMEEKIGDMLNEVFSKSHKYWVRVDWDPAERFNYVAELGNLIDCLEEKVKSVCVKINSFIYEPYVDEFYDEVLGYISELRDNATLNAEEPESLAPLVRQRKLLLIAKDSSRIRSSVRKVVGRKYGEVYKDW